MSKYVIHRDWTTELFQTEKIVKQIQTICEWLHLDDPFIAMFKIIKNFELKLPEEVQTTEIDGLILKAIEPLITEDPVYDQIATRQLIHMINKSVNIRLNSFAEYIHHAIEVGILDKRMADFDLGMLELTMDYSRDDILNYFGLNTLHHRYLIKDYQKNILEKPQWMWMRIAMGLSLCETNKEDFALQVYHKLSTLKYLHSTPTLFNSGTNHPQLISCFIGVVDDSLDDIMAKATETANYVKHAGGTAMSLTKLRGSGSHIKSINSVSCGPIPFIKIFDTICSSVAIGGKRASNMVVYMEPRHINIMDYLDLKETNGNENMRARKINTALWVPDLFMQRVESDWDRYLFDPKECGWLDETYGEEFEELYLRYSQQADAGQIKVFQKISAKSLYREILIRAAKSGNYRFNFKDAHNRVNQAKPYGLIHSTNMCTEISIANRPDSTATCTLASINLSQFVYGDRTQIRTMSRDEKMQLIDWKWLAETTQIAIRALDNVVELNYYVSDNSRKGSFDLRPLWLGIMWLGELFVLLNIVYDSPQAVTLCDMLGKIMYETALQTSIDLAQSRGTFGDYHDGYGYKPRRNILLLAIAPTASISNIAGTSSCIEPFFANVYSRETISGKFTIIVKELINQLKQAGKRNEEIKTQILAWWGSIQHLTHLSDCIDLGVYKTVYESSYQSQVDISASWQKRIDQSISRNIYVPEHVRDQLDQVYMYARKSGLKSTYYCFVEKNISGEKYTQDVNKRWERKWFGTSSESSSSVVRWFGVTKMTQEITSTTMVLDHSILNGPLTSQTKQLIADKIRSEKGQDFLEKLKKWEAYGWSCPVDPFEKVMCEGCQ
jgi:ribonucleoside-diphosphate reductase alpha chain